MADKRQITDRYLRSLRPAPAGTRIEVWDSTAVPGFGIRIHDTEDANPARRGKAGRIAFVLYARFKRGAASTRRTIGTYGAITLEDARRTAGEWRSPIDKGIDPAVVEAEAREKAARERALRIKHSFGSAAEAFITDKLKQERSGAIAERDFRANFVAIWRERPISEITKFDVLEVINAKKRSGAPQMARALLVLIRRFFNWCLDQHTFGLDRSPCDRLKPNKLIGAVPKRNRRLSDAELFAFWRATGRMKIPDWSGLSDAPAHRPAAERSRAAIVAGGSGRRHRHPAGAHEGQGRQGASNIWCRSRRRYRRSSHRCRASRAGSTCSRSAAGKRPLAMTGPIKADLDRRMLRTLQGAGPPSRRGSSTPSRCRNGSTTTCAARCALDCRHFASRTTSRKPCSRTDRAASSPPMTCMSIRTRRPRRWRHGRSGSSPSSTRSLPRPPRSSSCRGGGDDQRRVLHLHRPAVGRRSRPSCATNSTAMPTRSSVRSRETAGSFAQSSRSAASVSPARRALNQPSATASRDATEVAAQGRREPADQNH